MPKPKKSPTTGTFNAMSFSSSIAGESNDCAVKAVAIAAKVPYSRALEVLTNLGRQKRKGTYMYHTEQAMKLFGYKMERVDVKDFINKYPKPHCTALKNVTTHHPDRFNKVWADGHTYLMRTSRHILAIVDGVNHDWTRGTARPAEQLFRITKI